MVAVGVGVGVAVAVGVGVAAGSEGATVGAGVAKVGGVGAKVVCGIGVALASGVGSVGDGEGLTGVSVGSGASDGVGVAGLAVGLGSCVGATVVLGAGAAVAEGAAGGGVAGTPRLTNVVSVVTAPLESMAVRVNTRVAASLTKGRLIAVVDSEGLTIVAAGPLLCIQAIS